MLYTFARLGLLFLLDLFGMFCGAVLFPCIATLIPASSGDGATKKGQLTVSGLKAFFTDPIVGSVIGFVIMTAILVFIFYDDGKKHAAYEEWSWENILVVLVILLLAAFVPAIFRRLRVSVSLPRVTVNIRPFSSIARFVGVAGILLTIFARCSSVRIAL